MNAALGFISSKHFVVIYFFLPHKISISGTLFTCDPLTGHPGKIIIKANYGIGEVSEDLCCLNIIWEPLGERENNWEPLGERG